MAHVLERPVMGRWAGSQAETDPASLAGTDLERIFSDIISTAVTRAASIPCSLEEYRSGIELMASRLRAISESALTIERELLAALDGEAAVAPRGR